MFLARVEERARFPSIFDTAHGGFAREWSGDICHGSMRRVVFVAMRRGHGRVVW
jgi:hypothetical protein